MLSNKVRAVLSTVVSTKSGKTREIPKIAVIFRIAVAIRKFQRFESDKFKNSLEYNFDKQAALDELRCLYARDEVFFEQEFVKLAYFIRKFLLTFEDLSSVESGKLDSCALVHRIFERLKDGSNLSAAADQKLLYFLCLSLKYLTKNSRNASSVLEISPIAQLIKSYKCSLITTELVALLAYLIEKSNEALSNDLSSDLESLVLSLSALNQETKAFFFSKLETNKAVKQRTSAVEQRNDDANVRRTMTVRSMKKNQQVVTKTIQTVKAKQETKKSEETEIKFLNLSDCVKNRKRTLNANAVLEELETIMDKGGDDRSMWRTTWAEVINLYSLVSQNQMLKTDDKDNYLPDKFLGSHYFVDTLFGVNAKEMYSFFINQMCASIFLKASRKQHLNSKAIDKLLECVTSFDSLLSVLHLKKDYVDMFADRILLRYWDLKKITNPDVIVKFVNAIMDETTQEYVRFYYSTGVMEKSFDRAKVESIIATEINHVRRDAIMAIYNCAVRDRKILTAKRVKKINACLSNNDERNDDLTFTRYIYKVIELAESLHDFNYAEVFQKYVSQLKSRSIRNVEAILKFINNQAKDLKRSQELFTDDVIAMLIELLGSHLDFSSRLKEDVMEIINTYLEHELTKGISESNLKLLLSNTFESRDASLINTALTSLLLLSDKAQSFPPSIVRMLVTNIDVLCPNEDYSNYVLFILSRAICADLCFLGESDDVEKISHKLHCDHIVCLSDDDCGDGQRVRFEKLSEKNRHNSSNQISLLTAKIILKSTEKKIVLSAITVDNLLLTLNSSNEDDKQTKIVAAKCLYSASKYTSFKHGDLSEMLDLINSAVYDVSVYIQAVYLSECVKLAFVRDKCLDPVHLENISSLFVPESRKLGLHDYEDEINKNLFKTLLYEARKQKFNDRNLFHLFDSILNLNEKHAAQVLEILRVYTLNYVVPETTVRTLEKVLSVSSYFEKALSVLQNLILSGCSLITSKTLNIFIDYLYTSINTRLRFYSFKILEKVRRNQELADDLFCRFELAKAGYALENAKRADVTDKLAIIDYIQRQTNTGMQLPIDARLALEKEISHRGVLKIFANISKNRQIIPLNLLNSLIKMFDPAKDNDNDDNILLISIFENAAKNNQPLPEHLLHKLEEALLRKDLVQKVLPVFIYFAQKGEKLSKHVNDKLLDRLMKEEDAVLKQELLSSIGSLIDANQGEIKIYKTKINQILVKGLKSNNFNIQKLCILAIGKLVTAARQLDDELLHEMIQVGTNVNSNKTIRSEICSLFESVEDACNPLIRQKCYREKIKLANLNSSSNKDLLKQLNVFMNLEDGFLEQNYKQLQEIIDNEDIHLQEEALCILHKCKCKNRMTDELLESVAILYESTMSDSLKTSCLQLFEEAAKSGKMLKSRAHEVWSEKVSRTENIKKFFQSQVCMELKQYFQLSDIIMEDVLGLIKRSERISKVGNLADLIELIVKENSSYFESQSFVSLIEQCLLKKTILETTLPCYCRMIKEKKYCKVEECLAVLAEYFGGNQKDTNMPDNLLIQFFDAMYCSGKFAQLPNSCVKFIENKLDNSNEIVRGYSFKCLRSRSTDKFQHWCDQRLENLAENVGVKIEKSKDYLDLLEITASVRFLDVAVFKENKRETWKRELLVSSVFENFKVYHIDQVHFYTGWLLVEEKFRYHKSCKILGMIQMSKFDSFAQVVELISIVPEFAFDENVRMLSIYAPTPYGAFKQEWCIQKIQEHVSNKDSISKGYLNKLAEEFCSQFDVSFISKILCCIKSLDNLRAFEDLIHFCSREKIKLDDVAFENVQLSDLRCLIEAKHLCSYVRCLPESEAEERSIVELIQTLLNEGWNFVQLRELINSFNFPKFKSLIKILSTVQKYKLSSSSSLGQCKQILKDAKSFTESIRKFNKLAIENHFQLEGKIKDLSELLTELKKLNSANRSLADSVDTGLLNIKKKIFEMESDKLHWNEKQIHLWAKKIKENRKEFSDYEAIAVIMRANYLITSHTLTDTQILCSLIALKSEESLKGKLLEVATGEGKSTIICILAIINSLRGKQVDVITSSPVLAERDAKQKAILYRMFNLTCSDNNDNTLYLKGAKECYKADIVYGELSQFQFDMLRDIYSKLGTLGGRQCTTAIVDEVDSMLIDDSSKIARLSSTVGGMDHFQPIYVFLWQRLISIREKFIKFHDKLYFIDGKVGFENEKITLKIADSENNNIMTIPDLENYLRNTNDVSRIGEVVGDDVDEYLRKSLEKYLDSQIKENRFYIPSNFTQFLEKQKSKWIVNAIEALNYQENIHYVVQDGQIKPVDYYSTGIVQSSTNWSDGLHQFLQLKHNLKMTSETLTTNFLSNIGFIHKYRQVYGLTGTLGSQSARNVLKNVYKVELINVPQRRRKQYLELESVVVQDEISWLKEITSNIMLEVLKERGVLVICETIEHANRIREMLKNKWKWRSNVVKLYTMNDMNQEKNVENILPGEVIIATNLAGRGTDIQTDEIEASGGLHVILTYLPSNQRVEDQAFGRTARQGKRGTGLMILNARSLGGYTTATTNEVTKMRDAVESNQLNELERGELRLIQVKDKLFDTFCTFLNDEIRCAIRQGHNSCVKKVVNWFTDVLPSVYESNVIAAVEEQWAFFLRRLDDGSIKCEDAENKCKVLIDQLRIDFKNDKLIKNPYCFTCIAYDVIVNEWSINESSKARRALDYFRKAIELEEKQTSKEWIQKLQTHVMEETDTDGLTAESSKSTHKQNSSMTASETKFGAGAAHLGVAWCLILLKEANYKEKAVKSFKDALDCLSNEMSLLNTTQILLEQKQVGFVNSDLYKQLNVKATILGSYLNGIHGCIEAIKRSKRLIDVIATKKYKEGNSILERIRYFNELERNEQDRTAFKNTDLKLSSVKSYSLIFNCMTSFTDGTKDQALITVQKAFPKISLPDKASEKSLRSRITNCVVAERVCVLDNNLYSNIRVQLKQADLARISSTLFSPDKEFKDLTREAALAKLTELFKTSSPSVNLKVSSIDERQLKKEFNDKQINEIIKIIKDQPSNDATLRFDMVIKKMNENEINKLFTPSSGCNRSIQLNVDFDQLGQDATIFKLSSVKATSVDIAFVLNKFNLSKLIQENEELECGTLFVSKKNAYERIKRDELLKRVGQLKTDDSPCFIEFENLSVKQAKRVAESCHKDVLFAVSFNGIDEFYDSGLNEGQVNFYFDKLNCETAELVIKVLRKENFEFTLEFKNLSDMQVKFVLENASLDQEEIEITKVKNLQDSYMKGAIPSLELAEFAAKGIEHIIEINEKMFVPWRSVVAVAILGSCQVILGSVLIATGFGSTVGMGLVTEGLADMFIAYRAYHSRQFHWSDFCKQKAVSLAISAVSMGYSSLKGAAKGVQTLTTEASREVLEQAATQIVSNRKIVGHVMMKTSHNLKSLAYKYVAVKAGEAVVREGLNTGIQFLSNFSLESVKPNICESVQSRVRSSFNNTDLMSLLCKMHAIDLTTSSNQLQSRVEQIVADTINPRHDFVRQQWDSICLPLLKGILSDSNKYGSIMSMSIRIIGTLNGLNEVQRLISHVVSELVAKLKLVDRNSMTVILVLHRSLKMNKDNALTIANKLKKLGIFDEFDNFTVSHSNISENYEVVRMKIDDFSFNWKKNKAGILTVLNQESSSMEDDVERSIDFISSFYKNFVKIELDSFSMIIKSVSDLVTEQLIRIIDSQLIQPYSTLAVSNFTASLSARLQHSYLVDKEQNSESHIADQKTYKELLNKKDLTADQKAFIDNYGKFRTFVEQINYNAKDHCIVYSQCKMAYYASRENNSRPAGSSDEKVKQAADGVRNGKPATLGVIIATAKKNGINLKVVNDKDFVKTQEDIDNGIEVIFVERGQNNEIGHAYYMNSNGQFVDTNSESYDCIFVAFRQILASRNIIRSIDDLRNDAAQQIESNSKNYSKVLDAENWIRERHPNVANDILFTAGMFIDKETGRIKVESEDIVNLKKSIVVDQDRGGKENRELFQAEVPDGYKEDDLNTSTDYANHHIIPNHKIEEELKKELTKKSAIKSLEAGGKATSKENIEQYAIERVEEYMNQDHIKRVIIENNLTDSNTRSKEQHGKMIHAAISWNPHNLVKGPSSTKRGDDPKAGIEYKLLEHQTTEFQKAAKQYINSPSLKEFGKFPPTLPVKFRKDKDGKYIAAEV